MINKKAQGMPMNVIIIAIIVIVVLIILIAFFAGGFLSISNKIKGTVSGSTGKATDLAIQECQGFCVDAGNLAEGNTANSAFCKTTFLIDEDGNPDTAPARMSCSSSISVELSEADQRNGITKTGTLNVNCPGVSC